MNGRNLDTEKDKDENKNYTNDFLEGLYYVSFFFTLYLLVFFVLRISSIYLSFYLSNKANS